MLPSYHQLGRSFAHVVCTKNILINANDSEFSLQLSTFLGSFPFLCFKSNSDAVMAEEKIKLKLS